MGFSFFIIFPSNSKIMFTEAQKKNTLKLHKKRSPPPPPPKTAEINLPPPKNKKKTPPPPPLPKKVGFDTFDSINSFLN